ncbi:hypothetical protein TNCV_548811 [Trichonephila clavipes]|nr:hypothetical protein TNCV_548811 [Trichonephila clavipes]
MSTPTCLQWDQDWYLRLKGNNVDHELALSVTAVTHETINEKNQKENRVNQKKALPDDVPTPTANQRPARASETGLIKARNEPCDGELLADSSNARYHTVDVWDHPRYVSKKVNPPQRTCVLS